MVNDNGKFTVSGVYNAFYLKSLPIIFGSHAEIEQLLLIFSSQNESDRTKVIKCTNIVIATFDH